VASKIIAADWVVPVASAPIRDGAAGIEGTRVAWVGPLGELPAEWSGVPVDRRRGVITPGLVNAHTHLQYTHFATLGRGRYDSFEHWSESFGEMLASVGDPDYWRAAALDGARQAIASGTTVFGDVVTHDQARGAIAAHHVAGVEYLEAIGYYGRLWEEAGRARFLARLDQPATCRCGISPHAPYSLDGSVIRDLVAIARQRGLRVHSHVAESSVERNLYRNGDRSVLEIYGDLRDEFELIRKGGSGLGTGAYADSVDLLDDNTHLAHAIYLDRAERDLILRRGTRVVLCPRSNAVLGLERAPVAAYLAEGHDISVGTDSLASSPSLDLMEDVACLRAIAIEQGYGEPDLNRRLIRAATVGGARALGLADTGYGTLIPGGPADLAVFDIVVKDDDVEAALVKGAAGRCSLTIANGRVLHDWNYNRAKHRAVMKQECTRPG